ncbi:MAG TPA: TIGR03936 family radical SAM-associated protein, partial [Acidobacteriota bacterium]
LPGEAMADIEAIALLLEKILDAARARGARIMIHASFSSFVPKPHTPLQWAARATVAVLEDKVAFLKGRLKRHKNLDLDFHSPGRSMIETILARGDARVGELLLEVFRRGEIFTAWDAHFHLPVWEAALGLLGDADFLSELPLDAELPWDFIELNFHKCYLSEEYRRSRSGEPTHACAELDCPTCGGCAFGQKGSAPAAWAGAAGPAARPPAAYRRLRLFYEKKGDMRFLSHLAMMQYLERLLRKSGLLFKYSEGFHPRIKMAALPPLPVGAEGLAEVIEVAVAGELPAGEILAVVNRSSEDLQFYKAAFVPGALSFHKDLQFLEFHFSWPGPLPRSEDIAALLFAGDSHRLSVTGLDLKMDFAHQGQERFARIYRLLDPERKWTDHLRRTAVSFKNDD